MRKLEVLVPQSEDEERTVINGELVLVDGQITRRLSTGLDYIGRTRLNHDFIAFSSSSLQYDPKMGVKSKSSMYILPSNSVHDKFMRLLEEKGIWKRKY